MLHSTRRDFIWQRERRPYIILKWAETADGLIAPAHAGSYWISNTQARRWVHRWRSEEACIWVGKNTYAQDNPRLNVREWTGSNPVRIVVDPQLQLDPQLHVFDRSQPTLCYNDLKKEIYPNLSFVRFPRETMEWDERVIVLLDDLYQRELPSLFVEGGAVLLSFLLDKGWWEEARVFRAPVKFGTGITAPNINNECYYTQHTVGDNTLTIYHRQF